jgi:5'-nucleotidase
LYFIEKSFIIKDKLLNGGFKMNILVVNDDGYTSKGLEILRDACQAYGEVFVVAPHVEQSAKSSSITIHDGIVIHKHDSHTYSVEGTPSDCIKVALYQLKLNIDLVVSGINRGYNVGFDTIYSGTIGACMEALINGKQAIAFSSDLDEFKNAAREIDSTLKYILENKLYSNQYLLNVNFQAKAFNESKGILITDLGMRPFTHSFRESEGRFYPQREYVVYEDKEMTDEKVVNEGYISITPLKLGNGDHQIVEYLNQKLNYKN